MPDQGVSLHRVRGLVSGVNWRVTKFAEAVPHHLMCGLCHVISRTTFLLPCLHTLCESCVSGSVSDGDNVCPFDAEPFTVEECSRFELQATSANKLKACCWNEAHGCTFVGTLQAVLTHYEEDCTFHAVTCSRCNGPVLQKDLPSHYREGCHSQTIESGDGDTALRQGVVVSAEDIGRCLDELKALIGDPYQDRLPALQSRVNEILEQARNIDYQVEAIAKFCHESEHRLTHALGDLSTTFAQEIQSQQSALSDNVKKHFEMNDFSEQVRNQAMRIDAIARTLSDQLTEAKQELLTTFAEKLQCQQRESSAKLETISEVKRSNPGETETTGPKEMPWKLEKRHILRKLELIATDSLAYLDSLRSSADQQLKRPVLKYTPLLPGYPRVIPPLTGIFEREGEGYLVNITNIEDLRKSWDITFLFTRWYRRDRYLQVAAKAWGSFLRVFFKKEQPNKAPVPRTPRPMRMYAANNKNTSCESFTALKYPGSRLDFRRGLKHHGVHSRRKN